MEEDEGKESCRVCEQFFGAQVGLCVCVCKER